MDSLRMETNGGKKFIIHKVDAQETLFAISKKYNVKIQELINNNKGIENGININQEIVVPYFEDETSKSISLSGNEILHVVLPGETSYRLSKQYNISIDSLILLNGLESTTLSLGDTLIVGFKSLEREKPIDQGTIKSPVTIPIAENDPIKNRLNQNQYHIVKGSETLYSISRSYNASLEEIKRLNNLTSNELNIGQKLLISKKAQENELSIKNEVVPDTEEIEELEPIDTLYVSTNNSRFKERTEKIGNLNKTLEDGFAMKIKNTNDTRRYLALHRTAPVGTVIEVKNQMNNMSIFARVVGKLPETGINKNVLIRISHAAYEKLKALDAKIPVEIGYVREND
ncbi:LysM peptidoglycan-binding domain-containing protein [Reichenbachiella sp. MALMAid0571]